MIIDNEERYKSYYEETSRHCSYGTCKIMYKPWNHFDVKEVWAVSPHPLKGVKLGYCFYGDIPSNNKWVFKTYSVSTSVTQNVPKDGVEIEILSFEEAVKRSQKIDWKKVKIER